MLEPDSRQLLRDLFRPPGGYHLDRVIATTFSMDLSMLMTLPVAATIFDRSFSGESAEPDPLALLQAIRKYADRMHCFCQAGRISVPKRHQPLFAHLEKSVIEAAPFNKQGVFHPKLTLLRFVGDHSSLPTDHPEYEKRKAEIRYRLLCSSRNITFDRSWDTMVTLDGALGSKSQKKDEQNGPLAQFFEALPDLALREVTQQVQSKFKKIAGELLRVDFELPDGFRELRFHPLGIPGYNVWPFTEQSDHILIISPFLSEDLIRQFQAKKSRPQLISRPESLDDISLETLTGFGSYILHDSAEEPTQIPQGEPDDTTGQPDKKLEETGNSTEETREELTGLHAKVYIEDRGQDTWVWTGSANATRAAFTNNVEFLIGLLGPRYRFGVNTMIRPDHKKSQEQKKKSAIHFDDLLEMYRPTEEEPEKDRQQEEAEKMADQARNAIALAGFTLHLEANPDKKQYNLTMLAPDQFVPPWSSGQITVQSRPVALQPYEAVTLPERISGPAAHFPSVSFVSVSSFMVFQIEARVGKALHRTSFVLNLPVSGMPENRYEQLLSVMLENREKLIRYLLMLLATDEYDYRSISKMIEEAGRYLDNVPGSHTDLGLPLLEPLLRTLEQNPEKLDQVDRLVADLSQHEAGRNLLPIGFIELWEVIRSVRKEETL